MIRSLSRLLVAAVPLGFVSSVYAQPGEEPFLPGPEIVTPDWKALFPGEITDVAACKEAGGRWIDNKKAEGCVVKGQQVGVWFVPDEDVPGHVAVAVVMVDGELSGKSVRVHTNGKASEIGQLDHGKKTGEWRGYWDTGALRFVETWVDDKKVGAWQAFHPNGQPEIEATFKEGELEGDYVQWHRSCAKAKEGKYEKGAEEGMWRTWTDKGLLLSEGAYKAGKKVGPWKHFHGQTGALVEEGSYADDLRQGPWKEYFVNGQLLRVVEYDKGKRLGARYAECEKVEGATWVVDFAGREEGCKGPPPLEMPTGTWYGYFEDAVPRWQKQFADGVENGEIVEWHPGKEGAQKELRRAQMKNGIPEGRHVFYAPDGKVYGESTITGGGGHWRAYWPSGKVREEGSYREGVMDGLWRWFFETGNPDREETYVQGDKTGPMRAWFDTGEPKVEGAFDRGNRAGYWVAYWTNGRRAWEGAYDEQGNRTGQWKNFAWDGTLTSEGGMLLDQENGDWSEFYDSGQKYAEGPYVVGKKNGTWRFWWKSGEPWRTAEFIDGVEQESGNGECVEAGGEWVTLPEERVTGCQVCQWRPGPPEVIDLAMEEATGQREGEAGHVGVARPDVEGPVPEMRPGQDQPTSPTTSTIQPPASEPVKDDPKGHVVKAQDRVWTFWHANGKKEKEGRFANDKPHGQWTFWYEDGSKMLEGTFLVGMEDGVWTGWYRGGAKRFEGTFEEGVEEGPWKTWSVDGKLRSQGQYAAGKKIGKWQYFHAEGKVRDEGEFVGDEEEGVWVSYYPSGKKRGEGMYKAGKREGAWTWWREDGAVWRQATYKDGRESR